MLDKFCTIYINNILIYSNSKKEHQTHVQKVLAALQKTGLQANINKCKFHVTKINYLGLIISTKGICMALKKVEAIQNWETPTCIRNVQTFIRFANFYRCFIRAFFRRSLPHDCYYQKEHHILLDPWMSEIFQIVKRIFHHRLCSSAFWIWKRMYS